MSVKGAPEKCEGLLLKGPEGDTLKQRLSMDLPHSGTFSPKLRRAGRVGDTKRMEASASRPQVLLCCGDTRVTHGAWAGKKLSQH